jgi:phytoene desaturase
MQQNPKSMKVVVVGAGFGGMASALRARSKGYHVTLVDRLPQLGGRAQTFEKSGFKHDAGPTVITAPFLYAELFQLFGKDPEDYYECVPLDTWYEFVFEDGEKFVYSGNIEHTFSEIEKIQSSRCRRLQKFIENFRKNIRHRIHEISSEAVHFDWSDVQAVTPINKTAEL